MKDEQMKDWRGNVYDPEEQLGEACERCGQPAVRNFCIREGEAGRTHWHGRIHTFDLHLLALCRKCANEDHAKRREQ